MAYLLEKMAALSTTPSPLILQLQTFQNTEINCDRREENCKLAVRVRVIKSELISLT